MSKVFLVAHTASHHPGTSMKNSNNSIELIIIVTQKFNIKS